jgi:hypothetical protein
LSAGAADEKKRTASRGPQDAQIERLYGLFQLLWWTFVGHAGFRSPCETPLYERKQTMRLAVVGDLT